MSVNYLGTIYIWNWVGVRCFRRWRNTEQKNRGERNKSWIARKGKSLLPRETLSRDIQQSLSFKTHSILAAMEEEDFCNLVGPMELDTGILPNSTVHPQVSESTQTGMI